MALIMKKKWHGTRLSNCNNCNRPLILMQSFYDAASDRGWGLFCHQCFTSLGLKLGVGLGQKYDSKTLEKVAG